MKTKILILLLGTLFAFTLIGCSSKTSNSEQTDTVSTSSSDQTATSTNTSDTNTSTTEAETIFSLTDLEQYNGKDGNPAYVAIDGVVYDVTNVKEWKDGEHQGILEAGKDLTEKLKDSPHGSSVLEKLPVVGKLE